jgi:hypothetical protein
MWRQIRAASASAVLLAAPAGIACAQGSITQDPGSLTPGNLTFQHLGPAGPVPGPTETPQATPWPGGYGTSDTGTVLAPGTRSTGMGAGKGSGFGGNAFRDGR